MLELNESFNSNISKFLRNKEDKIEKFAYIQNLDTNFFFQYCLYSYISVNNLQLNINSMQCSTFTLTSRCLDM